VSQDEEAAGDPLGQEEIGTLEAELREALQHQRAAVERMRETQTEVETLLRRARELLERRNG
jgi:hypothetical protein